MVILLLVIYSGFVTAALGITPAKIEYNFVPGQKVNIKYRVITDFPGKEISISLAGDLSEYATLNKVQTIGEEEFVVTIILPEEIDEPGQHIMYVTLEEEPPEDVFIGAKIRISSVIEINVPFKGRYAVAELRIQDGNINEMIPMETEVINRGKENLTVDVDVEIFTESGQLFLTVPFKERLVLTGQNAFFRKFLNTTGWRPGNYYGEVEANYRTGIATTNATFRVGSLFVNVTDFTKKLTQGKIQRYLIDIESKWNGKIGEVFADVIVYNSSDNITFRTPSIDLPPWQQGELIGFIDTEGLKGKYDVNITLKYLGVETFVKGKLKIVVPRNITLIVGIIIAVSLVVIILLLILWFILNRKKNSEKNKKNKKRK